MKALIYGSGAQGMVVLDILRQHGSFAQIDFIDDNHELWGEEMCGAPILGGLEYLLQQDPSTFRVVTAMGHPIVRMQVAQTLEEHSLVFLDAVHVSAIIMPLATMGVGNMIGASAVVNSGAIVGNHTIVNSGAVVEHNAVLEDGVTLGPGVLIGGRSIIGLGAFVGTGAIVLPRITVGEGSVIAAGAVVTNTVPSNVLVLGMPARIHAKIDDHFDWQRLL